MAERTLGALAERFGVEVRGDPALVLRRVASLESARPGDLTFVAQPKYLARLPQCRASAVIVSPKFADRAPSHLALVLAADPYLLYAKAAQWLHPEPEVVPGVHPSAVVLGEVDPSCAIGPNAVVEAGARVGARTVIGAGSVIGADASVGSDCRIAANVTIYPGCVIGARVRIHSGAVIGADGFGFAWDGEEERWVKIPQIGRVVIGDDVEIGANTSIDRGALEDTVIEDGVILDNQIQIGHNCHVGAHTAMAGCVGVGGSTRIGRRCRLGGQVGIAGHVEICDDVTIMAGSGVMKPITKPGVYGAAIPLQSYEEWRRNFAHLRHLDAMADRIRRLERRLAELAEED